MLYLSLIALPELHKDMRCNNHVCERFAKWKAIDMESNLGTNETLFEQSLVRAKKFWTLYSQFSSCSPLSEEQNNILLNTNTCIEILKKLCIFFENRPAIGFRIFEKFETISYKELWQQIEIVATGLQKSGNVQRGNLIGICAFGSLDFVILDFACLYLGAVPVPLQTNLPPSELKQIINDAEITTLVTNTTQFENVTESLLDETTVKNFGIIDLHEKNLNKFISENQNIYEKLTETHSIKFWDLNQMRSIGDENDLSSMVLSEPQSLATLVYTSGSTGLPKGAMITHKIWLQAWKESGFTQFPQLPFITLNFMPLNHIMGRYIVMAALQNGGTVYFTKSETMSTLFEDMRLVGPTILFLVPRISEMIYQQYQLKTLQEKAHPEEVMEQMGREFLGDRLLAAVTAAAPTSPALLSFLKKCFKIPVFNSYGSTEAGILTFENKIISTVLTEYKLVSVPDCGYFTSDKPYPRGELRIKSTKGIAGYYKNQSASNQLFDEEGFLKMGDIVEEHGPGEVVCIDRIKNIQKLANGEFVALARLENIFSSYSSFIYQIYLYGQSSRSYLLGVIVPNEDAVRSYLNQHHISVNNFDIKTLLKEEMGKVAKKEKLFSYEIPRDFIVETKHFTKENHLLTESNKYARSHLKEKYSDKLNSMYNTIEEEFLHDLVKLNHFDDNLKAIEKIKNSLATILNIDSHDLYENHAQKFSFKEMGGDSLNAVTWSTLIEQLCGLKLSVSSILNPANTIQKIIANIEIQLSSNFKSNPYSFESIHGKNPEKLFASDLKISRFFDSTEISQALKLKETNDNRPIKNILLTGGNGFLGKFLTFELLAQTVHSNGKIYCIIRAENDEKAYERIIASFNQSSHELKKQFNLLPKNSLIVLAGDLTSPRFGLTKEMYDKLTADIDAIVHNGALVNHAFPYSELFEANVFGTVEVIRFAITKRLKSITFISSIAVTTGLKHTKPVSEDEDIRTMWPERQMGQAMPKGMLQVNGPVKFYLKMLMKFFLYL